MLGTVGVSFVMFAPFVFQFLTEGEPHRLIVVEHYSLCVALFCVLGISYLLSSPPISPAVLPFLQASQYNKYVRDKLSRTNKKKKNVRTVSSCLKLPFSAVKRISLSREKRLGLVVVEVFFCRQYMFPQGEGCF